MHVILTTYPATGELVRDMLLRSSPARTLRLLSNTRFSAKYPSAGVILVFNNSPHKKQTTRPITTTRVNMSGFYSLKADLPGGKTYDFADLKGKTVLVVNVASQWYGGSHFQICVILISTPPVDSPPNTQVFKVCMTSTKTRDLLSLDSLATRRVHSYAFSGLVLPSSPVRRPRTRRRRRDQQILHCQPWCHLPLDEEIRRQRGQRQRSLQMAQEREVGSFGPDQDQGVTGVLLSQCCCRWLTRACSGTLRSSSWTRRAMS